MKPSATQKFEQVLVGLVFMLLLGGIGGIGWLIGHVLTYDATGHAHAHAEHGYMAPIGTTSVVAIIAGAVLAAALLAIGRERLGEWLRQCASTSSALVWVTAASVPAVTFIAVELAHGSIAERGLSLLLVGVPMQVLVGCLVLLITRRVLTSIVDIAARMRAPRHRVPRRAAATSARSRGTEPCLPRRAPMASNGALRGPPVVVR